MSDYFIGHGIVYAAQRDSITGLPTGGFIDLGNCPSFLISPGSRGVRQITNPEDHSPMIQSGSIGMLSISIDELNPNNLAQAFYGEQLAQSGTTVVGESVSVYTGRFCPTEHINISSVSVAGKTEGVDYTVDVAGGINVIQGVAIEGESWSISYTYTDHNITASFSKAPQLQWIRLNGINVANDNSPVVVDVYKVRFSPISNIPLITDSWVDVILTGKILYDSLRPSTTLPESYTWGNYFRIRSV